MIIFNNLINSCPIQPILSAKAWPPTSPASTPKIMARATCQWSCLYQGVPSVMAASGGLRSLDGKDESCRHPSIHPSQARARSTLRTVQHRPRQASCKIFQPRHRQVTGSSRGSRRTPSQRLRGRALSNWVLILRFRKAARACKAVHRDSEQSPRLENVTAVSLLTGDRKLRLLNQDRQKINRLRAHF